MIRSSAVRWSLVAAVVGIVPWVLSPAHQSTLNFVGIYSLVTLGILLLTGIAGATSFGQAAFVGLGAYVSAALTTGAFGVVVDPWISLIAAVVATAAAAYAIGYFTLGLSGHYLPVSTIAWGISIFYLFGTLDSLGGQTGIGNIPAIGMFGWKLEQAVHMHFLIWSTFAWAGWCCGNLLNSRQGRAMRALKSGAVMPESLGVDTRRLRTLVFVLAGVLGGTAGWLYAHVQRFVNPSPFSPYASIEFLFMAVIGGAGHLVGAVLGTGLVMVGKEFLQELMPWLTGRSGSLELAVFGVLVVLLMHRAPSGLTGLRRLRALLAPIAPVAHAKASPMKPNEISVSPLPSRHLPLESGVVLSLRGVTRSFGGLVANNNIGFDVYGHEIVAVIGPNGAGKSTLFNLISGVDHADKGEIVLCGQNVERASSRRIAEMGLARTFQHVHLMPSRSVLENVALGAHLRGRKGIGAAMLRLHRHEEQQLLAEARYQIDRCGLGAYADEEAGSLSLGQQRLIEVARALAADPTVLLLDEPAAGLRHLEKSALADVLRSLKKQGLSIVLVEHDMDLVMDLADRIVVMEFGQKIAEGTPSAIQSDARVVAAYLGESVV